ncbi:Indole-3-acetic acid-amido synthetase GH3.17 [Hibiscus syriacus]|uniref:Indole-3-acetic acid-amido synthetase GH3.17 n=1 Tax=Hibiscus syriacus TaxID=106335 RepID=A0A6A3CE62_HIBSY|nr:Indole-3-acetic acid-amido synthetase GH3.17 [Hibiscus syriacus]
METKWYEEGLRMIEELTTHAERIQDELLREILSRNAGTDSGTSGGQLKMTPVTAEVAQKGELFRTLYESPVMKHFGDINQAGKRMEFMFARPEIETPSGLTAASVTTSIYKESWFRAMLPKCYTSPVETIFCPETEQSLYCQLLFGLIQRDEVVLVGSVFASALLRAVKFLENHWRELCSDIKAGQISHRITDSGCRSAASLIMKPNPQQADLIENICNSKSWEGIIRKLWPKANHVRCICTGVMRQYTAELEFYSGGLPLVSALYASSEAHCGINLNPLCKPADVSYTFLPNMAYFEFLPPGYRYELLVTTSAGLYRYKVGDVLMVTGFHNNAPQFQFVERQNVAISVDQEKTSESDLFKAVTEAKALLDPLGFVLTEYTSYADTSSAPGHYVLFWELKQKEGNNCKELDPKIMVECCYRLEGSLHYTYKIYMKKNIIAPLEIRVVKQGTFDALMDHYVSKGASLSQYKRPSCIKS